VGPGSPEGDAPVTTSTTKAADQAARSGWWPEIARWRVKGHFIGECTRTRSDLSTGTATTPVNGNEFVVTLAILVFMLNLVSYREVGGD
jgi:hypothetical protein